ncbi:hypothetical protein AN401_07045 [Zobellella denitrificans]|uniref:Uncharacterized protein n=1 Tax=Zobellella denitrificans TaxID=347534 RepID=A0A291HNJ7_9GAMM|nr:hypothetical protein [Zobellella denitrificans]ATG73641.1 hypothetical protein AN401_07045 [Zobellella denitrificans]
MTQPPSMAALIAERDQLQADLATAKALNVELVDTLRKINRIVHYAGAPMGAITERVRYLAELLEK